MFTINIMTLLIVLLTVIFNKGILIGRSLEAICYKHINSFMGLVIGFSVVSFINGGF